MLEYQLWILQGAYFEEVVVLVVAVLFFLCLLFFVDFIVLSLEVEVFCAANTAVPESSERPRAAVISFFIWEDLLNLKLCVSTYVLPLLYWQTPGEATRNFTHVARLRSR
jgi:hypothetical protein